MPDILIRTHARPFKGCIDWSAKITDCDEALCVRASWAATNQFSGMPSAAKLNRRRVRFRRLVACRFPARAARALSLPAGAGLRGARIVASGVRAIPSQRVRSRIDPGASCAVWRRGRVSVRIACNAAGRPRNAACQRSVYNPKALMPQRAQSPHDSRPYVAFWRGPVA